MPFSVTVDIALRPGISDPAGSTIERALPALGFAGVRDVTVGKRVSFTLEADDEASARAQAVDMCERFLTNPVIESADVSVSAAS